MMKGIYLKTIIILSPWVFSECHRTTKETSIEVRPNILIAMGDDISFPHMSAYGTKWIRTPGFDMVAEKGILFRNAYTPNAKSSPSRACFLTGRNSWQLEEACNHIPFFPPKFKTFIEALDEHGYFTGYTAKGWAPGVALDSMGNPRQMTGKAFISRKIVPPSKGISDIDYSGNFDEFMNNRTDNKPFCFWYGSNEPHRAYENGSGITKGGKKLSDIKDVPKFWPQSDIVRQDMLDYAFEIEYFDYHLVRMLEILKNKGELENTIVIVTADNGMPFPRAKGQAYEYSNHLPLAIMWGKGIKNPGRTIYDFISFIDFAPTLLELAGIEQSVSGLQQIEGTSFTNIFYTGKKGYINVERDHVLIGKERHDIGRPDDVGYPIRGIVKDGFLLLNNFKSSRWPAGNPETGYMNCDGSPTKTLILDIRRSGLSSAFWNLSFGLRGSEELYNIGEDPECINNLARNNAYNSVKVRLQEKLYNELLEQNDPRITGKGDIFDEYPYAQKTTKDFYNRFKKGEISRKAAGWVDSTDFENVEF
jgi:N-sulfoglucosamine sulfohydrolase